MSSKLKAQAQIGERVNPPTTRPSFDILPSKPVAHLTGEPSNDFPFLTAVLDLD